MRKYKKASDVIPTKEMLDILAEQIFDLERDNDLLRGQITELTHKMDFVMGFLLLK